MNDTKIDWTDKSWNPCRGCSRVSLGCVNCYAERMASRYSTGKGEFAGFATMTTEGPRWTGKVKLLPSKLKEPLAWKRPGMIFVNSMSDLFHEKLAWQDIDKVFAVMALAYWHNFQILTKRASRMREYLNDSETPERVSVEMSRIFSGIHKDPSPKLFNIAWPLENAWIGVSVENQKMAEQRIPELLSASAKVKFLSIEPMLETMNIERWVRTGDLHWVIVGCESGPNARPMKEEWATSICKQCLAHNIAFFLKQIMREGKLVKTPKLHGSQWTQYPKMKKASFNA